MKKLILVLFILAAFSHSLYADDPESKTEYAKKGILEYGGGVSFRGTFEEYGKHYSIGFSPHINYFIFDKFYLGISPVISYNYNDNKNYKNYSFYSLSPTLSIGYAIGLSDDLFFNIAPNIGSTLFKHSNSSSIS